MVKTFAIGFVLSATLVAFPALAQLPPRFSRPSAKCAHSVPNGAHVDASTGVVTLNGATVATYDLDACASESPQAAPSASSGGYFVQDTTQILTTPFDAFDGWFVVPPALPPTNSINAEYWAFFPGLSNCTSSGCPAVLQPLLEWTLEFTTPPFEHIYTMSGAADIPPNLWQSPQIPVGFNDYIYTYIDQTAANEWLVQVYDATINEYSYMYLGGIPSSWTKFNTANVAFEGYTNTGAPGLPTCGDVPASGSLTFNILTFDKANPSWNSYKPYTGSDLWNGYVTTPAVSPPCDWNYAYSSTAETLYFDSNP